MKPKVKMVGWWWNALLVQAIESAGPLASTLFLEKHSRLLSLPSLLSLVPATSPLTIHYLAHFSAIGPLISSLYS